MEKQGLSFLQINFNQNKVEPLSSRKGTPLGMPYPILLGVVKRVRSSRLKPGMSRDSLLVFHFPVNTFLVTSRLLWR